MTENRRLLAIDDDYSLLEVYQDTFRPESSTISSLQHFIGDDSITESSEQTYDLSTATQGEEGIALVQKSLDQDTPFAAAFIDIRMPPGIDGLDTAQRIRELDDRIYIILVTAYSDRTIAEIQQTIQHDILLAHKPLARDEILQLAHNACHSWEQDERNRQHVASLEEKAQSHAHEKGFLERIVRSLNEGLLVCSLDNNLIVQINPAIAQISGHSEERLLGMPISDLLPELAANFLQNMAQQEANNVETTSHLMNAQGIASPVYITASKLQEDSESLYGNFIILIIKPQQ
ncbi:MAG: response regulator [Magnetococcales bacterium]|nr:response regulator [Magnetococcales bacterium]